MARKRMIDPSFWIDEQVGTSNIEARLLFMGLISQADDDGRLNGHPNLIKSIIFPYDGNITADIVDEWLELLAVRNLIIRYDVNNQKFIFVKNFKKHQTINKPVKSKLPEPPHDNYRRPTVAIPEAEGNTPSQEKGIEEKLREEEDKGREFPPASNPHEDHVQKLLLSYQIDMSKPYPTEQFFSYIGAVDLEVIEAAIKKSTGKQIAYCLGTLEGMVKDGITKEHLRQFQVVKGGKQDAKHGAGHGGYTDEQLNTMFTL